MSNPFRIEGPALISFSGGRTSAYMLRRIIDAWDGELPADVRVTFANTGKEREETMVFVAECGRRWNTGIVWLERIDGGFREVSFGTAKRNGEPFRALIDKKGFLPNPVTRFCTQELKIRAMRDYMKSLGYRNWTNAIGLRADEPRRIAKMRARNAAGKDPWDTIAPLADAGVIEADIMAYWRAQPFDLGLTPGEGNCDLCFLKGASTISAIIARRPDLAHWWIEAEAEARASKPSGAVFRQDRPSYAKIADAVARQKRLDFGDADQLKDCMCTE